MTTTPPAGLHAHERSEHLRNEPVADASAAHVGVTLSSVIARRLTAFLASGAIVLAACGGSDSPAPVADAETETRAPETAAPATPPDAETPGSTVGSGTPVDTPATAPVNDPDPATTDATNTAPAPTGAPSPSAAPPTTEPPTETPVAVPEALNFSARLLDGSEIELGAYAGRPVLLWFWAPW